MSGFVLDHVSVADGATRLVDDLSADLPGGRCTAVVGPSGAGKSTVLRLLNRLLEPSGGRILLDGTPIVDMDVLELRRRVSLIAQRPVLLTARVADELRVGRPGLPDEALAALLVRVGLPAEMAARDTAGLSGGEAQRVCLARALAVEPDTLLLDEPTSALDETHAMLISDLAKDHVAQGGTVVLVSHDLAIVRQLAQHVLVIEHGRLIETGAPDDVRYLEVR